MFTQPFETLNPKRIKYYEDEIRKGQRPMAIAIRVMIGKQESEDSYQDTTYNSTKYISGKTIRYKLSPGLQIPDAEDEFRKKRRNRNVYKRLALG